MKIVIIVIGAFALFNVMSCNSVKNTSRCQVYNTSIKDEGHSYEYMLSTEDKLYLIGSYRENYKNARTDSIIIKEAHRGLEGKWTDVVDKITGKCEVASQTSNYIYIISLEYHTESYNPKFRKHKLYRISKESGRIEELYEWDIENSVIKDIYFDTDEIGYIFFRPSGNPLDYQFLKTNNGGKEWNIIELNRPVSVSYNNGEKLYFLSYKNNIKSDWIYLIDKKSNELDSSRFELDIIDFAVGENGDYWLLGNDNNRVVLQHYENGKATDIHTFLDNPDIFPQQLYKYNELIVVIASQIDENMLFGIGGTRHLMFVSKDNGVTWNNHSFEEAVYLKPISFYKDEQVIAYGYDGKILTCKFR